MSKTLLFKKCTEKNFHPAHVAEVGVYFPETSNIYDFIKNDVRTTLVEPDPKSISRIKEHFAGQQNITLHEIAIYDQNTEIELVQRDASTFMSNLEKSPAIVNDGYQLDAADTYKVQAKKFDAVDDGKIDLLSIDIEGGEWFVIKHMRSRPTVISIETHGASYTNPYLQEILSWMEANGYFIWYKTNSDTVFAKKDKIQASLIENVKLSLKNFSISFRRFRKNILK